MTAVIAGGCIGESSLEFGTRVNLHVWTTETTVEVDASGWLTTVSSVYLCFDRPPRLPSDSSQRVGWTPGASCQDYGSHASAEGFTESVPLSMLDPVRRERFEAASDRYLLLVAIDGDRATSAFSSRSHAPPGGVP